MRTTLTIDEDIAVLLRAATKRGNQSFKQVVNEALRHGLKRKEMPTRRGKAFRTREVNLGRCLIDNVDNVADVLASAEGESLP